MSSEDSEQIRATVASRQGQACVFREKSFILPCELTSSIADSWGVRLSFTPIEADGFLYPQMPKLNVSVVWGSGCIGECVWSGGQAGGWTVYFDESLFRSLKEIASQISGLGPLDRWRRLADHINEWDPGES